MMLGFLTIARAMAMRCFCPPESLPPRSPTCVRVRVGVRFRVRDRVRVRVRVRVRAQPHLRAVAGTEVLDDELVRVGRRRRLLDLRLG